MSAAVLPEPLSKTLYGFIGTSVLVTGNDLGAFDALVEDGPSTAAAIAERTGTCPRKMERLLNAGCAFGLVVKAPEGYRVPDALRPYLARRSPDYCGGLLAHFRDHTVPAFGGLRQALEAIAGEEAAAIPPPSPFGNLYGDPATAQAFLDAMWHIGYPAAQELAGTGALAGVAHLVDVGGATGSFAIAQLEHDPQLRATVFDLPQVEPYFLARRTGHVAAAPRLGFTAGDFWRDPLPRGDAYAFGYILSDWPDEACRFLVRKATDALPAGGVVVVLEKLLDACGTAPASAVMQDMAMMLETGGRHRSEHEYVAMLADAGLNDVRVIRTRGEKHMVIGRKP